MKYLYPQLVLSLRTKINEHYDQLCTNVSLLKDDEPRKLKAMVQLEARRISDNALLDEIQTLLVRLWPYQPSLPRTPQQTKDVANP